MAEDLNRIVFVGLNGRVAALDRNTGIIIWKWRAPQPSRGYVSLLLLDERQLIASINGYTYCLDPRSGEERWFNELTGFGCGVTSIVALDKHNPHGLLVAAAATDAAAASGAGALGAGGM